MIIADLFNKVKLMNGFEKWQGIYTISNSQKQEMYHSDISGDKH
jgi:hypothetical protein